MQRLGGNRCKAILGVIMVLCMVAMQQISTFAEEVMKVSIDQYTTEEGKIHIYVNHNQGENYMPTADQSKLLVGKQSPAVESVTSFKESGESVTYLLMVDVSGSMNAKRVDQAKEIMKQMVDNMEARDNCNIAIMGNNINSSGFINNKEQLAAYIDEIAVTKEDTNLYAAIKQELEVLKNDKIVHNKRCLVVFSDGADDQQVGITKEEAENIVKDSHIPVFTIALINEKLRDSDKESAKILGSFARDSAGGEHFAPLVDGGSYDDIANEIKGRIDSSLILTADLSQVMVGDDTVYIETELSNGKENAKGSITVPSGSIKEQAEIAKQRVAEVSINVAENNTPEPVVEDVPESNTGIVAILIIVILAIAVLIAIVFIISHKKRQQYEDFEMDADDVGNGSVGNIHIADDSVTVAPIGQDIESKPTSNKKYPKKIMFTMYKIGPGEDIKYELPLRDEITIGRAAKCTLSLPDDNALSGNHCTVIYRNGEVYVKDNDSTNGTFANGVPIVGELRINQDDVLLIGSNEYRIAWK